MFRSDVLCVGSATIDNFLTIGRPLSKIRLGDKVLVKSLEKHSGGGATNAAATLAKLGLKVKVLTKLGHDHGAEFILKELKDYKIKNVCLHQSKKNTDSATIISSTKERDRIIYVHKGASLDLTKTDFKKSQLNTKWIYLASLMGKSFQVINFIAQHKSKKTKILFNPSLYLARKGKKYLGTVLKATEVLVLNKEEAQALLKNKSNNFLLLLEGLQQSGPKTVIITNGNKRLHALHKNKVYTLLPPKVKIIHTAGAGDAFTAGFLAGMIKNYSFEDALRLGQVDSTSVIQHIGTKNKLLTESEAKKSIKKYKIKCSPIQKRS